MKKLIYTLAMLVGLTACDEDFMEPKYANELDQEEALNDPQVVQGFLLKAYNALPNGQDSYGGFLDCATQNAVINLPNNQLNKTSAEEWQALTNPLDNWKNSYQAIQSINRFIEFGLRADVTFWKGNEQTNAELTKRFEGEAYFLRAYFYFDLLKRFAGQDASGELMGVPLITKQLDANSVPELPRATFREVLEQIVDDLDYAVNFLPVKYSGTSEITGQNQLGRATSVACYTLKSRVMLYAGSELYGLDDAQDMNVASVRAAGEAFALMGKTLPDVYINAGNSTGFDNYFNNGDSDELIMRRLGGNNNGIEGANFPPSYFGNGRTNPTQNLVDAFPTADGFPIDHASSSYDPDFPYANRDPRFYMTVLYNGASFKDQTVNTSVGGKDYPGGAGGAANTENSTRTGYYLRKWLSTFVDKNPANNTNAYHYFSVFRKGEVFLNYAEAANEAFGPNADPYGIGMTAVDAIREVRRRAGIAQPDTYLNMVSTDQDAMRELIRNERRIELCFEGHYFYDLRRWKEDLNEPVEIVTIEIDQFGLPDYAVETLFTPTYKDYMYFGPMPYFEAIKTPSITQNTGW
ncbi:RagB/SusD family nutrient uptake outer membrane protein [Reichenbachiella agarivorans]|uniref:RagB/SusD family nutrient uptake outer membrane protein n=1 Tax=Reichenbachiella agarivorans TaxID=2979464 RepID=A0ABY6CQH4_9BACT|nr:RagB/SusD family nutrient uptake outer membrane protein [Reichenbachiella agarivorans]UXP32054.1 RagB/SusD family nutrient uptake outer membrane protein [Reichenbachiella agarivorans]